MTTRMGTPVTRHKILTILMVGSGIGSLAACGSAGPPSLSGAWSASDGSGTKVFNGDGSCSGMYYNQGKPLDIGGGMTCTLGSNKQNGRYPLTVQQPPNGETLYLSFSSGTEATVYDGSGNQLFTMSKN